MFTIKDLRQHSDYDDYSDEQLGDMVFNKYYKDRPELRDKFNEKFFPKESVQEPAQEEYKDNIGAFSYLADIRDRGKAIDDAIETFNQLRQTDETAPEYQQLLGRFIEANKRIEYYSDEDNWLLGLGKAIATDVAATLGGGVAGATVGGVGGPVGGAIGGAIGAGAVGFARAREQNKIFNAYRELTSSGDLTSEELKGAVDTAFVQAGIEGLADAVTGGIAGKVAKSALRKIAVDAGLGGATEVNSALLQRAYVSNLDILGEDALEEYFNAFAEGVVAQGILSAGFRAIEGGKANPDEQLTTDEVAEMQADGFLSAVIDDYVQYGKQEDLRVKIEEIIADPNAARVKAAQFKLNELAKKKELSPKEQEKKTKLEQKVQKYTNKDRAELDDLLSKRDRTPEEESKIVDLERKLAGASTLDLFETPTTTIKSSIEIRKTPNVKIIEKSDPKERDIVDTRTVREEGKRDRLEEIRYGTIKVDPNTVEISNIEPENRTAFDSVISAADRTHNSLHGRKKGKSPKFQSKNKMSNAEYRAWDNYRKMFAKDYKIEPLPADKINVSEDGTITSSTGEPLFVIKEIPPNLSGTRDQLYTKRNIVPKKPEVDENRDGFFRKDPEAQKIEDTLTSVFGKNPAAVFGIRGISDKNLKKLAETKEYKALQNQSKQLKSLDIVNAADQTTDEFANSVKSNVASGALPRGQFSTKLKEQMESLLRDADTLEQRTQNFGNKTPDANFRRDITQLWPKFLLDTQALARRDPQIAEIFSLGRSIQNQKDGVSHMMKMHIDVLRGDMKKRGTWQKAHEQLELLDRNGGDINSVPSELRKDVQALDEYYKIPLQYAREVKQRQLQNVAKINNPDLQQLIEADIKKIDAALSNFYFPRRRFGELMMKVGDHFFSIDTVQGIDHLNRPGNIKISESLYISKDVWDKFKVEVKSKTGVDLNKTPSAYFTQTLQGDVPDLTMFRSNMKNLNAGKYAQFLEDESVLRLLSDADRNKLEYFKRYAKDGGTLGRLLTTSKKTPGWSTDYDRIATDHYVSRNNAFVNYLYEPALRKVQSEYLSREPRTAAEKFADRVFGDVHGTTGQSLSRLQAFLALAFSPATAVLQATSLMTTVPLVLSTAIGQIETVKATSNPKGYRMFINRFVDPEYALNYNKMKRDGGKEFADFVFSRPRMISNTPKQDYDALNTGKRGEIGKALDNVEDMGHSMMLKMEESTRLQSAFVIFEALKNPKNLAAAKKSLSEDARYQEMIRNRGDIPEREIISEILIDNAFGVYGKLGWAEFQASNMGRIITPFISYPLQMTTLLIDHFRGVRGAAGQIAGLQLMVAMPMMFGLSGAPFFEWFQMIYDFYNHLTNKGQRSLDNDVFDAIYEINPEVARFLKYGFTGSAFGVDVSKRVALGNPFSGLTGVFTSNSPLGRDIGYLLPKASEIAKALKDGDPIDFAKAALPISMQNVIKGFEYSDKGATTKAGEVIIPEQQLNGTDITKRLIGFNPTTVANAQTAYYHALEANNRYAGPKRRIVRQAYPDYKEWLESGKTNEQARQRLINALEEYREIHLENGDPYTPDKANGLIQSLLGMYRNEKGFVGGEPKSNLSDAALKSALERYEKLEGQ